MEAARCATFVFVLSLLATAFAVDTIPKLRCQAVTIHNSSYPTAGLKVDFMQVLSRNSSNVDECIAMCCRLGVEKCQFAWKFQSNCLAVACLDVTKCSPETGNNQEMTYVSVSFTPDEDLASDGTTAPTMLPAATISSEVPEDEGPLPSDTERPTTPPAFLVTIRGEHDVFGSDATLYASFTKQPSYTYGYLWEQVDGPNELTISEKTKKMITLHSLERGVYTIKLTVDRSDGETSQTTHDLVIHNQLAPNLPPQPVILPSTSVTLRLPSNSATFDASQSTDDLGQENLQFDWTLLKRPASFKPKGLPWVGPKLVLSNLVAGFYQIRLGVTDGDGTKSFAEANVTVLSDQDLPPVASAGGPVVVQLPVNVAVLMGNYSTDDKGIVHYSWTQTSGATVELHGEKTAFLHVANLQEGLYSFTLTVTDTASQSSSKEVDVQVQAASASSVPVEETSYVRAGGNVSVYLPDTSATLRGSASPDVVSLQWTRMRGPADIKLQGADSAHLSVSGLHLDGSTNPTVYQFRLTARNKMNQATTDTAFVFLYNSKGVSQIPSTSLPPPPPPNQTQGSLSDVTIILPENSVTLTGGLVDHGAAEPVQYMWSRSDSSPAIGRVAHGSDSTPNLHLTDLTNGTYVFTMATANAAGQWAERRKVTLRVKENPLSRVLVQIVISVNAQTFTQADLMDVSAMLKATLNHAEIVVQKVTDLPPNVMIEFYATDEAGTPLNSTDVQSKLTENGASFSLSPQYLVLEVETKVCQNMCSGRGFCSTRTKKCVCNIFWVENPFKSRFGRKISNCDWSVFYIMLVVIGSTIVVTCLLWLCCCCCIKSRNNARKRRIRYAILAHKDNEENLNMLPKGEYAGYAQTSLMVSEEEEEIVFDAVKTKKSFRKPANGTVPQSTPTQQREKIPNRSETKSV